MFEHFVYFFRHSVVKIPSSLLEFTLAQFHIEIDNLV